MKILCVFSMLFLGRWRVIAIQDSPTGIITTILTSLHLQVLPTLSFCLLSVSQCMWRGRHVSRPRRGLLDNPENMEQLTMSETVVSLVWTLSHSQPPYSTLTHTHTHTHTHTAGAYHLQRCDFPTRGKSFSLSVYIYRVRCYCFYRFHHCQCWVKQTL